LRNASVTHPMERVGKKLRSMMSWLRRDEPTPSA